MDWIGQIASLWLAALVWIAGLAVVFLVLTRFSPCNPGQCWWTDRRAAFTDLVYWLVLPFVTQVGRVALLVGGVLLVYGNTPPDDWAIRHWPIWVQCLSIMLIQDTLLYWLHRLFHTRLGWKFHAVHHSPEVLDWTSTQRFHPVNAILEFAVADVVVLLLGFSPNALVILGPLNMAYSVMVHANLNWTFGPFRYLLVSPVYHRWHHTAEEQGRDRNFASTFPFLDLLFGTYYLPVGQRPELYGTSDGEVPPGFVGQMAYPFRDAAVWAGRHPALATVGGAVTAVALGCGVMYLMQTEDSHPPAPTPVELADTTPTVPANLPNLPVVDRRQAGAVAVSVKRSQVMLGGSDGSLVVQDATGGERSIAAHVQRVNALAISPNGEFAISGSGDGTARVWATDSGQSLRTLHGHGAGVMSVSISSDGWVATGTADGVVRVWNEAGELTAVHRTGVPAPIHAVAVCDGGQRAVVAQLSTAFLWDTSADRTTPLTGLTDLAYCVGLTADGGTAITGGYDGVVKVWGTTGKCRTKLAGHNGPVYALQWCDDGKRIVTGGADRTVRLWQADGQPVRVLGGHEGLVFAVSADDAGRKIAAASKDGCVSLWDVADAVVVPASANLPGR